jgi:hypothetical protein
MEVGLWGLTEPVAGSVLMLRGAMSIAHGGLIRAQFGVAEPSQRALRQADGQPRLRRAFQPACGTIMYSVREVVTSRNQVRDRR